MHAKGTNVQQFHNSNKNNKVQKDIVLITNKQKMSYVVTAWIICTHSDHTTF
jgi:hypothetical protein